MSFFLLIDDVRSYNNVEHTARTAQAGRKALLSFPVTHLLLDNDLGPESDMEGIDVLQWARDRNCVPEKVIIVSSNGPCRKRMEDVLYFDLGYKLDATTGWWTK